jgi:hypothetical protein
MNAKEFVDLIRLVVSDAAIVDTIAVLNSPPGRKPAQNLLKLSQCYNEQSLDGKAHIDGIIKKSVEEAVFGFFCVLDGVRSIESAGDKGSLSLWHEGNDVIKLNLDGDLHDIYSFK